MATVPNLTADATPTTDDLLYVINSPGGTPADRKVTIGNLLTAWSASSPTFAGLTLTGNLALGSGTITTTGTAALGATTVTGNLTASGLTRFGASSFSSGSLPFAYKDTSGGLALVASTGSLNDFIVLTSAGASIMSVPTGTRDVSFSGKVVGSTSLGYLDLFGDSAATLGVRITDAGAVRIGTTSATSHAQEVLRVYASTTNSRLMNLHNASAGQASYFHITTSTSGTASTDGMLLGLSGADNALVWNQESTPLLFGTANTERGRWASNAYALGIGTTDIEAWTSTHGAIEFGASAISGVRSTNEINILSDAYNSSGWKYKTGAAPSLFQMSGGNFTWHTASSGTADAAISWSATMRVSAARNLLLGTTTDPASAVGALVIGNGTAASAAVADAIVIQSEDMSADNTILSLRVEGTASLVSETITPDRTIRIKYNGAEYKIPALAL